MQADSSPRFTIEPFDKKKHDRTAFLCEHEALNAYIKRQASQDIRKHVAAVFVLTPDGKTIAGYYTLSQYAVDSGSLPEETMRNLGLPKYKELPATLLGRLARSLEFKGKHVGELLLMGALKQAFEHSLRIASVAVVVDAKDEIAKNFYKKYGFLELPDHPRRLFLPMKTVEHMFVRWAQAWLEGDSTIDSAPGGIIRTETSVLPNGEISKILSIGKNYPIDSKSLTRGQIYFRETWRDYPPQIAILKV